jgi:subtilase family serine protease
MPNKHHPKRISRDAWWLCACAAAVLSACGGGSSTQDAAEPTLATQTVTLQLDAATLPDDAAALLAQPSFHVAPLLLNAPDDTDAADRNASAGMRPRTQAIPAGLEGLSTRRLTAQAIESSHRVQRLSAADGNASPLAGASLVATYSPAQIRAAYGLPALPAAGTALTASQAAQLGAGQTIYIVDAMHDPNIGAELAAFNQKFALPACTTRPIATNASLPLARPSASACEFSVVYNTAGGTMTGAAPAYEAGWATEITLDVQWAHATAPLARIVLIEAADASLSSLLGAVKLANAMGPGVVSMSFGADEGSYTASVDAAFAGTGMSYLAATGDSGAGVSWPSVSPKVVAVGGTRLSYSGSGARTETAWSGTGGGTSAYTPTPSYQTAAIPGMGNVVRRTVADVAFNADPGTGQYVAVMSPGSSIVNWLSVGGTSLSTPQWAGLLAVANAMRAANAQPAIASAHSALYGQIGAVPGAYASAFADITQGSNGSCSTCAAKAGYDPLSGLGTPNASALLSTLAGAGNAVQAPVVSSAAIGGKVGTALSFTVSATAPNPVTYSLSGAPAGMAISTAGLVSWAKPVAGVYAVTAIAKDSLTGLSGQGLYTVTIAGPAAPVVLSATISGSTGVALSFNVSVTAPNAVAYSLAGAPAGMSINSSGKVSWAKPVAGTYGVAVIAKDAKTGLSGQGVYTVQIATPGPVITAPAMAGVAGRSLVGKFSISAPGATSLSVSISGVPPGMTFTASGLTFTASWASPLTGSYALKIVAVDSAGKTASATVPVTITAK